MLGVCQSLSLTPDLAYIVASEYWGSTVAGPGVLPMLKDYKYKVYV